MANYLGKIRQILNGGLEGKVKTFENLVAYFSMNEKTSVDDITQCNQFFNNQLPEDYKVFLQNYNGGILFRIEDFIGYDFLGTQQLITNNTLQKNSFAGDWDDQIILFCRCLGDAEYFGFKINDNHEYEIVHCFMDEWPDMWKIIDGKLDSFIMRLIDEQGKEFWYDD
jgi:hypothetical protein